MTKPKNAKPYHDTKVSVAKSRGDIGVQRLMVDPEEQGIPFRRGHGTLGQHLDRESRRLHRTLYWYVKSKLEAIDAGLETPTQAWLAAIEGPRGHTIYQEIGDQLRQIVSGDLSSVPMLPPAPQET